MNQSVETRKIVAEKDRYVEIYQITCLETNKSYVGQAVSHILNTGKYRRYGMEARFRCHVSEAFSKKKNQCHYLNNAIKKYGVDNFEIVLLEKVSLEDSDNRESFFIEQRNTMFPNGYNLKHGTITTRLSEEGRKRVSDGVYRYYYDKKHERFKNINIPDDIDSEKCIKPLRRKGEQYGWYVYIDRVKADFGGIHISIDISKQRAVEFIQQLKTNKWQDSLMREFPKALTTTLDGNIDGEHG